MKQIYHPSQKVLDNYADVLVNFALNQGRGVKAGETVYVVVYETAKPLLVSLRRAIIKAGAHIITDYRPDVDEKFNMDKEFYMLANDQQLAFFPKHYMRGLVNQADHSIFIISETNKQALAGIDPQKIMKRGEAFKPYMDWRRRKENQGRFSWTLALYGTDAMAKEAGMSVTQYWNQITKACFLDKPNPISLWRKTYDQMNKTIDKLNKLKIKNLYIQGPDVDLKISLGENRRFIGGRGANIPSFEIFTSPDWRGTQGWVKFNQPLYRYGNLITDIELEFENGRVTKSKAKKNYPVLKEMIASVNADKVGEFSLTDKRFSRIDKFMAETLYDENIGGANGNFHIALGAAYHDCHSGDISKVKKAEWKKLGFNDSSVHTDIISTSPRIVTATLQNGQEKVIYKNGMFTL
jgi:aminopeptidase